jgi:iron(III) transport system substrate-binding protein
MGDRRRTTPCCVGHLRNIAALLTALLVVACGSSTEAGPAEPVPSGEVVLYTSMPTSIVDQLELIFEGTFPDLEGQLWLGPEMAPVEGITLGVVRASTGNLLERIEGEVAGGGLGADVVWLADPAAMDRLKGQGLLAPYAPPADAPIAGRYIDPDGFYVAGRVINMVVAWNTALLPDGLDDWSDLLINHRNRAFPSPRSGAALAAIKALTDAYGEEYFQEYVASGGRQVENNGAARDSIAGGDFQAAVVLDYMIRQARADGIAVDFAYPTSGTVVVPSPIAITSVAANPEAATVFVDFVLSQQGQRVLVEIGSFYPVRSDVEPPPGSPPLDSITVLPVDWTTLVADTPRLEAMWQEVFR